MAQEPRHTDRSDVADRVRDALSDRYDVLGEAGRGGMGTVLLADDRKHGRRVAIKVMDQRLPPGSEDRFRREIAIAAQLSHPHIVPLHDSGVAAGLLYYVMPFVDGPTLRERLERQCALPVAEALAIARDVAEALDHAHGSGVVHRDVKPANILLSSGHALVADFGVARALAAAAVRDVTVTSGAGLGSPAYMSPEQALGDEELDGRADVYALGCVVFEMLSGERPYASATPLGMVASHVHGDVPGLEGVAGVTPAVAAAVRRAMAKNPEERFPTAGAFVETLGRATGSSDGATSRSLAVFRTRHGVAVAGAVLAVGALGVLWARAPRAGPAGGPTSFAVLPFETSGSSEEERATAADLAAAIGVELNHWDSVRAVPTVALAGPMFDLGLTGPTVPTVEAGLRVARALDVGAMLSVRASLRGDTVEVEASLFDARTGRADGRPATVRGGRASISELARRIAWDVLGIDPLEAGGQLHRRTSSPGALLAFAEGDRALERWRLGEAERHYREALARDSTFSLAYLRLAQALYWDAAAGSRPLSEAGPEIARLSGEALRRAGGLSGRDSLHVRAFHAFQSGDYPRARSLYGELLELDPADVYAWLMLGSVEFRDPWLVRGPEGLRPRADLGAAIRAFEETLRLQPTFELGYGHLFDIHQRLAEAAHSGGCHGFEEPRDELLTPWETEPPDRQVAFCPVAVGDSIRWVADMERLDRKALREAADALFRRSLRMSRRWVDFAPDQPRPREALAEVLLQKRRSMEAAPPAELEALAREARDAAAAALALRADTLPRRLYRLASLHLASAEPRRALELLDSVRAGEPARWPEAANVLAATGRIADAVGAVSSYGGRWYLEPADGGGLVAYGGGEPLVLRMAVLTGLTAGSDRLVRMLDSLDGLWSDQDAAARALLRADATRRALPALAADSLARAAWARRVEVDHPLWRALAAPGLPVAEARALLSVADTWGDEPSHAFVSGHVALRAGVPEVAARYFARLDSLAYSVESFSRGWGLRSLGAYWRGRAHEAAADTAAALQAYAEFRERWFAADDLAAPLAADASARSTRLTGRSPNSR